MKILQTQHNSHASRREPVQSEKNSIVGQTKEVLIEFLKHQLQKAG